MVNTYIYLWHKYFSIFLFFTLSISLCTYLIFFVSKFEYIKIRLLSFLDTSSGNNYQADRASDAISSGGFLKKELGGNIKLKSSRSTYRLHNFSYIRRIRSNTHYFNNDYFFNFSYNVIRKIDQKFLKK